MRRPKNFISFYIFSTVVILLLFNLQAVIPKIEDAKGHTLNTIENDPEVRAEEKISTFIEAFPPPKVFNEHIYGISGLLMTTEEHTRLLDKKIKLFWDNELVSETTTGKVGGDLGRFSFNQTVHRPPGEYTVLLVFSGDMTHEYSQYRATVKVEENAPDLLINSKHIFVEPDLPTVNSTVQINSYVRNIGGRDGHCRVSVFLDGTSSKNLIGETFLNVSQKGQKCVSFSWKAVPGNHIIWVSIDHVSPEDLDPTNNLACRKIYVDPVDNSSWPMFRHDIYNSGFTGFDGPRGAELLWSVDNINIGSYTAAKSSPSVHGDKVIVGGDTGKVSAFNKFTGEAIWEFQTDDSEKGIHSTPSITEEMVFIGSYDHNVYALDYETGKEIWRYDTGGWVGSSPTVYNGKLFVGSDVGTRKGQLLALNSKTGKLLWAFNASGDIHSSPAISPELGLVYVGSNDNDIYALDMNGMADGDQGLQGKSLNGSDLIWNFSTGHAVKSSPTFDPTTGNVAISSWDGFVYMLNGSDGQGIWKTFIGDFLYSSPAVSGNRLFVVGHRSDGQVHALNKYDGTKLWSYNTGAYAIASPTVANGTLYLGLKGNNIIALDVDTGSHKFTYETAADVTASSAVSSEIMFVSGDAPDGKLYAFGRSRAMIEFCREDVSIEPEYALAGQPVKLKMKISNVGTQNCRLLIKVLSGRSNVSRAVREDEAEILASGSLDVEPWKNREISFELFFHQEGQHRLLMELSQIEGTGAEFLFGGSVEISLNVSRDTDEDGLPDAWELEYGSDKYSDDRWADPDRDGLSNLEEYWNALQPAEADSDLDGLADGIEMELNCDPLNPDTDGDGMPDGWEHYAAGDPTVQDPNGDQDGDGLDNVGEFEWACTPVTKDSDRDGIPDKWETTYTRWDPNNSSYTMDPSSNTDAGLDADRDGFDWNGDGVLDEREILSNLEEFHYGTDPGSYDSDYDGIPDGEKLYENDLDRDGMPNWWEERFFLEPFSGEDGIWDSDGDGVLNYLEWTVGTHPTDPDTDNDGICDGSELDMGTDPNNADSDSDGMPDGWELSMGTDPLSRSDGEIDHDGDGLDNLAEYAAGTDPFDPDSDGDELEDGDDPDPMDFTPISILRISAGMSSHNPSGLFSTETLTSILFNGSLSFDKNNNITQYFFDFGDGNNSGWTYSALMEHIYYKYGLYKVELRVKNDIGKVNVIPNKRDIFISNRPPVVKAALNTNEAKTFSTLFLNLSGVRDLDGFIINLSVGWGDGNDTYISSMGLSLLNYRARFNITKEHRYTDDGTYEINITAMDNDGGRSSHFLEAEILNRAPTAIFSVPDRIITGQKVVFNASAAFDRDGRIVEFDWEFEDGRTYRGETIKTSFSYAGSVTVKLKVTDDDGEVDEFVDSFTVAAQYAEKNDKPREKMPDGSIYILVIMAVLSTGIVLSLIVKNHWKRNEELVIEGCIMKNTSHHAVRKIMVRKRVKLKSTARSVPGDECGDKSAIPPETKK